MARVTTPALDLYTSDGWINIPAVAASGAWCIVLIGKRQVGKTYGTLKYMLDEDLTFLYMRRTMEEFETIVADPDLNPFLAMRREGYDIDVCRQSKQSFAIGDAERDEDGKPTIKTRRAVGMTLQGISKIRGFNGSAFTDLVFDEFIPERIVVKRKAEGDAFLNALVTIGGNRELEGKPPLRVWLLANAFDIASPILGALDIMGTVDKMSRTGKELALTDSGILIALPHSDRVTDKRKQTALMRHLAKSNGKFYQMAMENKFAYNNLSCIRPMSLKGMRPAFCVNGAYVYHMDDTHYYACSSPHSARENYRNSVNFQLAHPEFRLMLSLEQVYCADVNILMMLREFLDIKD